MLVLCKVPGLDSELVFDELSHLERRGLRSTALIDIGRDTLLKSTHEVQTATTSAGGSLGTPLAFERQTSRLKQPHGLASLSVKATTHYFTILPGQLYEKSWNTPCGAWTLLAVVQNSSRNATLGF
ncbi:unnamed protein product [Cercospora beticola]|nr:unnamed protein product [Cercospora beticola]